MANQEKLWTLVPGGRQRIFPACRERTRAEEQERNGHRPNRHGGGKAPMRTAGPRPSTAAANSGSSGIRYRFFARRCHLNHPFNESILSTLTVFVVPVDRDDERESHGGLGSRDGDGKKSQP